MQRSCFKSAANIVVANFCQDPQQIHTKELKEKKRSQIVEKLGIRKEFKKKEAGNKTQPFFLVSGPLASTVETPCNCVLTVYGIGTKKRNNLPIIPRGVCER